MKQILLIRENIIRVWKRYEAIILFILKFFAGLVIFNLVNAIGYPMEMFETITQPPFSFPFTMMLCILFAVLPVTMAYALIVAVIGIQLSSVWSVALIVVPILLCILFFYVRLASKESIFILITFFAFYFHIPYITPLLAGLYFGITTVIPVAIGIFLWEFAPLVQDWITKALENEHLSLADLPGEFSDLYILALDSVNMNGQWIFVSFIFAIVIIVVYLIARLPIDYSKDIAIWTGAFVNLISFIISAIMLNLDINILAVFGFTLLSAFVIEFAKFFDNILDYQRAEQVQFEDEENYYYVKVIPKVMINKRRKTQHRPDRAGEERYGR